TPLDRRQAIHAALAEVLAGQPDRRIWHQAAASTLPDESMAAELQAAATHAERRGAIAAAVAALEQAARLSEDPALRVERLLRAAYPAVELGRRETVDALLYQAAQGELTDQQKARVTWIRGSFDDGLSERTADARTLAGLAQTAASGGDTDLAVRILWSAAMLCFWTEPGPETRAYVVEVAEGLPLHAYDPWLQAILA